jgi:hypothetical protein
MFCEGFESRQVLGIFLFTTASRPVLEPTQSRIQWIRGALSLGAKRPVCEADHSPPSSAKVKNVWSYTSTPPICFHGVVLSWSTGTTLSLPYFCWIFSSFASPSRNSPLGLVVLKVNWHTGNLTFRKKVLYMFCFFLAGSCLNSLRSAITANFLNISELTPCYTDIRSRLCK